MSDPGPAPAGYRPEIVVRGDGTTLVLMHGTLMDHRMFDPQVEALSGEMRVVAFDSRARTSAGAVSYGLDDLADDCCRILDDLGIDRAVIGGMSMGAFTALRVALRHPDRVAALVLIGGHADGYADEERAEWSRRYAERRGEAVGDEFAREEVAYNFFDGVDVRDPELRDRWLRRFAERDGTALHFEAESWLGMEDVRDRVPSIAVPSLVIHGDRDASIPVEMAVEMYRLLPRAELLVLPQTGHAANLERPDEVNRAISEFMERLT